MTQPIPPVAKSLYICDDVVRDSNSGKVTIINLWDTIRVPSNATFPYRLKKMSAFAWLKGGLGRVRTRIAVVQGSSFDTIYKLDDCVIEFRDRIKSEFARYNLERCVFPEPGYYYVELHCEDQFIDDQLIHVTVAKESNHGN